MTNQLVRCAFLLVLTWILVSTSTAVKAAALAQESEANVEQSEDASDVADSDVKIHRINMGASNAYLIETDDGMVLVDAGLPFSEWLVLRMMKEIGRDDLSLIYITHAHIDHYGSAKALSEKTGAPIAIHKDDASAMAQGRTELGTVRDWSAPRRFHCPSLNLCWLPLRPKPIFSWRTGILWLSMESTPMSYIRPDIRPVHQHWSSMTSTGLSVILLLQTIMERAPSGPSPKIGIRSRRVSIKSVP